jgi:hypothetical protein
VVKPSKDVSRGDEIPNAMLEPADEFVEPDPPEAGPARPKADPQPARITAAPKKVVVKPAVESRENGRSVAAAANGCRLGSGWADRAVCNSANLSALDRQHGLLYAQSLAKADDARRAALLGSRERFQVKRDACRSENCLTTAYINRLREISDIMARGAQP